MKTNKHVAGSKQFIQQFYLHNRVWFGIALFATMLGSAANLVISWLLQQLIDVTIGNSSGKALAKLAVWSAAFIVGVIGMMLLQYTGEPRFYAKAIRQYKELAFKKLMQKGMSAFSKENTAVYISAFSNDITSIEKNYLEGIFSIINNVLLFVGALGLMLWYSPLLTLAACVLTCLPVLASMLSGNKLAQVERQVSDRNENFIAMLKDSLGGFSVIKSFKAEKEIEGLFTENNQAVEGIKRERRSVSIRIKSVAATAGIVAQLGVFLVGAYLAVFGKGITPGIVMAFVNLMNFVIQPVAELPELLANRKAARALIDKLSDAVSSHSSDRGEAIPQRLTDAIEVRDVSFSYDGKKDVLKHMNARFEAGKSYAIVGASGSGKSTLLTLLMAGNHGYTGSILYDGKEVRGIKSEALYDVVSIVQQNVFVFNSSVQNNITMFRDFDKEQVEEAIRLSGLEGFLKNHGEAYMCGENGCGLSGGEKQRISIARSLLRNTPVLMMDEATSALDGATAFQIISAILDLKGLTRIVVTHTLEEALLKRYDKIFVLKNGCMIEEGSFEELMNKKDYFYSLFTISQP